MEVSKIRIELDPDGLHGPLPFTTYTEIDLKDGLDLDVDSDNNGSIEDADDPIEAIDDQTRALGKIVYINNDPDDGTVVLTDELILKIPDIIDISSASNARLSFDYSMAPFGTSANKPGHLRLWTAPGGPSPDERNFATIDSAGHAINKGEHHISHFTWNTISGFYETILHIEGMDFGHHTIRVELDPNGGEVVSGNDWKQITGDEVYVSVFAEVILGVDGNRDGTIDFNDTSATERTLTFWINDDIDVRHRVDTNFLLDSIAVNVGTSGNIPLHGRFGQVEEDDIPDYSVVEYENDREQAILDNQRQAKYKKLGVNLSTPSYTIVTEETEVEDHLDDIILCKRDLEDFARLQIRLPTRLVSIPDISLYLKFENITSGSPKINLFPAVKSNQDYLLFEKMNEKAKDEAAEEQILEKKLDTIGNIDVKISRRRVSLGSPVIPYLFEGTSSGLGDLIATIKLSDGTILGTSKISLNLEPIRSFYDNYKVGYTLNEIPGNPWGEKVSDTVASPEHDATYTHPALPSPDTNKEYLLFVHGWNMHEWEKNRFAETALKRMWWSGYTGRFGFFNWPGTWNRAKEISDGLKSFNMGEYVGWQSGEALYNLLNDLKGSGWNVHVLAHSQGNVPTGSALKRATSISPTVPLVTRYIATQAAIAAHYFDNAGPAALKNDDEFATPDLIGYYPYGNASDPTSNKPYLHDIDLACEHKPINFHHRTDYAMSLYRSNNERTKGKIAFINVLPISMTVDGAKEDGELREYQRQYSAHAIIATTGVNPSDNNAIFTDFRFRRDIRKELTSINPIHNHEDIQIYNYGSDVKAFFASLHWQDSWADDELQRLYEFFAFVLESRSHPLGSAQHTPGAIYEQGIGNDNLGDHVAGPFDLPESVDLSKWQNQDSKAKNNEIRFTAYHTGHSHQFRGIFMELRYYWQAVGEKFELDGFSD